MYDKDINRSQEPSTNSDFIQFIYINMNNPCVFSIRSWLGEDNHTVMNLAEMLSLVVSLPHL